MDLIIATCHCRKVKQAIKMRGTESKEKPSFKINLCHCSTCRHATGLLCTSYSPLYEPASLSGTKSYSSSTNGSRRYFCSTCGFHVYRSSSSPKGGVKDSEELRWEVSTGVLSRFPTVQIESHIHVSDTKDGGISPWIRSSHGKPIPMKQKVLSIPEVVEAQRPTHPSPTAAFRATCLCKKVDLEITRPDPSSTTPKSNFPDLLIPYHTQSPQIQNPHDEKWWLRANDTKNLAGTCVCRSRRLTSGFEIQTWAFVPRCNVFFYIPTIPESLVDIDDEGTIIVELDFNALPEGILHSYESSPGVIREFCGTCGATVFWHDSWRPELVDVSVGLIEAEEGARAEDWLEWWTESVSFEEEYLGEVERIDGANGKGKGRFDFIEELVRGLREWRRRREGDSI